jgi:hypothetical protein
VVKLLQGSIESKNQGSTVSQDGDPVTQLTSSNRWRELTGPYPSGYFPRRNKNVRRAISFPLITGVLPECE